MSDGADAQGREDGFDLFDQPAVNVALEAFRVALNAALVGMGDGPMVSLMISVIAPRGQASVWEGCACDQCSNAIDAGVGALLEDFGAGDACGQVVVQH